MFNAEATQQEGPGLNPTKATVVVGPICQLYIGVVTSSEHTLPLTSSHLLRNKAVDDG